MTTRTLGRWMLVASFMVAACGGSNSGGNSSTSYMLTVQKGGTGSGLVTGAGINCGSICSLSITQGTAVSLTVTPDSASTFGSWNGCDSWSGTICNVTMNGDHTVTAILNGSGTTNHTLTVQKGGTGSGKVSGGGIDCGATCSASIAPGTAVSLTAMPDSGSSFGSWSGCDSAAGTTCSLTMNSDRLVTANFTGTGVSHHTLTVQKGGTGSGTVAGGGINCGSICSLSIAQGTAVSLTATPDSGSSFGGWSGCDTVAGTTCSVTMNADHLVNATFTGNGPPPPTGLSVGSATTSSLFISWNASVGATSYQLFRNASQVFSGSGTSYTDTGLASGTTYQYAVRATNSFGSSALSSAVSGTTLAATQICFWSNDGTDGTLTVYVDGIAVGNLTQYFLYPVVPSWGAAGTLVVTVQPGSHRLTAQSQSGALSWDSSVTLTQGEQLKFQLTVTQWCFWTKRSDVGAWINIDIDSYLVGSLTHFFAAQPSWCASGALVVTTSPGSHTLYAYSQGGTYWGPASLSLTSGQQQFFELK